MMKKKTTHILRRILLPCFIPPPPPPPPPPLTTTTKKRLSTSLRDDPTPTTTTTTTTTTHSSPSTSSPTSPLPPRHSKSMVTCTFFGHRHSPVFFCVQLHPHHHLKPSLLLQLSLSTHSLVHEMRSGLLRLALQATHSDLRSCPLHSVPLWSVFCNGRRVGSASKRRPSDHTKLMLKNMENTTVGAGVIPFGDQEVMYMRANYEWVVGGSDSESFHLISPDDCPGQELSVFLLRSR